MKFWDPFCHCAIGHGSSPSTSSSLHHNYHHHHVEVSKPPPGPRMPDGTRGFTLGRGKPLPAPTSAQTSHEAWWGFSSMLYHCVLLKCETCKLWELGCCVGFEFPFRVFKSSESSLAFLMNPFDDTSCCLVVLFFASLWQTNNVHFWAFDFVNDTLGMDKYIKSSHYRPTKVIQKENARKKDWELWITSLLQDYWFCL